MEEIVQPIIARDMSTLSDSDKPREAAVKTAPNSHCNIIILPMANRSKYPLVIGFKKIVVVLL